MISPSKIVASTVLLLGMAACRKNEVAKMQLSVIDIPIQERNEGYLDWLHDHKDVLRTLQLRDPGKAIILKIPELNLYSPTGKLLYNGTDAAKNAAFLKGLEGGMPKDSSVTDDGLHPSLADYLKIYPQLNSYKEAIAKEPRFTILAFTSKDFMICAPQNEAIASMPKGLDLRVLVVSLKK